MTAVIIGILVIVALGGSAVALTRDPAHQVILIAFEGLALSLLFVALEAPEVALSQLAVGAVLVPIMYLSAIARATRRTR